MIVLTRKDTGEEVGRISEDDFQFLVDQLEEESDEDTDYYIDTTTVEMLEQHGESSALTEVLKKAVGDSDGVEVSWSRE